MARGVFLSVLFAKRHDSAGNKKPLAISDDQGLGLDQKFQRVLSMTLRGSP